LRVAIWGDNRAAPDPSLDHYLKNVDVAYSAGRVSPHAR